MGPHTTERKSAKASRLDFKPVIGALKTSLLDRVLPPRCPVTGEIVEQDAVISANAWKQMRFLSDPKCGSCGWPFEHHFTRSIAANDDTSGLLCPQCLKWPPYYDAAQAVVAYNDASRRLILSLKYGDQHQCSHVMARLMKRAVRPDLTDLVIPVPLHPHRLIRRRFNQSALLAKALSQRCGLGYCPDLLVRTRATPPQKDKNTKERRRNVKKAFAVPDIHRPGIDGARILLIDDVFTTGATVNECARVLKAAGAGRVDVLCFARTVRE